MINIIFLFQISVSSSSDSNKSQAMPSSDMRDDLFPKPYPKRKAFIWVADRRDLIYAARRLMELG